MAYKYSIDHSKRRVEISFEGELSLQDINGLREDTRDDPQFDPAYDQLIDGRNITSLQAVGSEQVKALATNRAGVHEDGARRVFVVNTDLGFGFARMFQLLSNTETDIHVCRSYEEAIDWLG